jgi:hypothetical protein
MTHQCRSEVGRVGNHGDVHSAVHSLCTQAVGSFHSKRPLVHRKPTRHFFGRWPWREQDAYGDALAPATARKSDLSVLGATVCQGRPEGSEGVVVKVMRR